MNHVKSLGILISAMIPVKTLCVVKFSDCINTIPSINIWQEDEIVFPDYILQEFQESAQKYHSMFSGEEYIDATLLSQYLKTGGKDALIFATSYNKGTDGILYVDRKKGIFKPEEIQMLKNVNKILPQLQSTDEVLEVEKLSSYIFNTMLDGLKASIYITDPKNDLILFMNANMKKDYNIAEPEGKVCWQILQHDMERRCGFCPVRHLLESKDSGTVIQWEENSTVTGRSYQNYDSLIRWIDGSLVHLQQSIDITDFKSANKDDLTQLLVRRPGKEALRKTISAVVSSDETATICLYDINLLKETNDQYGHAKGDQLIVTIVQAVQKELLDNEYMFRLSGDEFVVVFACTRNQAVNRMNHVLKLLKENNEDYRLAPSFCFGLAEIKKEAPLSVEEALMYADEQMYEYKRKFHILYNEQKRIENGDVCQRIEQEFAYNANYLYDALVKSTDDYIYICNMKTGIFRYTEEMVKEFELPAPVLSNATAVLGAKVHEEDKAAFLEANQIIEDGHSDYHCVEYRVRNRNHEWTWVRCRGHIERSENGEPEIFAGFITNLGKKNQIDHLTGLYNKLEFNEVISDMIQNNSSHQFGIMLLGIDDLKHINDLHDRNFGDEVIRIIAQKIQTMLPSEASIFRLDGDEYGIIAKGTDKEGMLKLYDRIYRLFEYQQEYAGKKYYSTLSAGCAVYPEDTQNALTLIKYADYAMETAKKRGKKICVAFSTEILDYRTKSLEMIEALRESVENDFQGFELRFQPIVTAKDGNVMGLEALARWYHERYGWVAPNEFIPLLESSGLILPVGRWILSRALRVSGKWLQSKPELEININISYLQIEGPDFLWHLHSVIEQEGFPFQNLVLEMTESVMARESAQVKKVFEEIRKMGVRIAMDDFGTGYSTLGLLKTSPVHIVKIDKTFMKDILTSSFDMTFIQFIVALCHNVGISVCLEGVETSEEYQAVTELGLDMIQGYYFGYPLEENEFYDRYIR